MLSNLYVSGCYNDGIDISVKSASNIIQNCISHNNGHGPVGDYHGSGILAEDGASLNTVVGCTSYDNAEDGVAFSGLYPTGIAGRYNSAINNLCYGNTEDGIDLKNGPQIIAGNILHDNTDYGIICDFNCDSLIIQNNVIYNNTIGINYTHSGGAPGTDTNYISRNLIYSNRKAGISLNDTNFTSQVAYNVIYNNASSGIICWTGRHFFYNNTIWSNAIDGSSQVQISASNIVLENNVIGGGAVPTINFLNTTGQVSDYNDLYAQSTFVTWGGVKYTFANYRSTSHQDGNSINTDPLFASALMDFHLSSTSPCIRAGNYIGLTTDFDGNPTRVTPGSSSVDIGAFAYNQGSVSLLPKVMQFDGLPLGQRQTKMLRITNVSATQLAIDTIRTTDRAFTVSRTALGLAGNAIDSVAISFAPTEIRSYSATLLLHVSNESSQFIIKLFGLGSSVTSAARDPEARTFDLQQNFPNPFNPTTVIRYIIPQENRVVLQLFDIVGRHVATIVDEEQEAGSHEATLNGRGLSSGTYFYRLRAGSFLSIRKCVVVK